MDGLCVVVCEHRAAFVNRKKWRRNYSSSTRSSINNMICAQHTIQGTSVTSGENKHNASLYIPLQYSAKIINGMEKKKKKEKRTIPHYSGTHFIAVPH